MMSANTAWLAINNTKPPLDDPAFRKALATSIDVDTIVNVVYTRHRGRGQPDRPAAAVGAVRGPGRGGRAGLQLRPRGRQGHAGRGRLRRRRRRRLSRQQGRLAHRARDHRAQRLDRLDGVHPGHLRVGQGRRHQRRARLPGLRRSHGRHPATATFDLAIVNDKQLSNTPWTYYNYIFRLPIQDVRAPRTSAATRTRRPGTLVQQLDQTPVDDVEGMKAITSQLQTHPPDRPAHHPALVQRHVVAGQRRGLDQLAVRRRQPVPADHLAWLLADGRHPHARRPRASRAGRLTGPSSSEPRPA